VPIRVMVIGFDRRFMMIVVVVVVIAVTLLFVMDLQWCQQQLSKWE
jgi:hypothetical protein